MYASIDAEVACEIDVRLGSNWEVLHCDVTYLAETSIWFGKEGRNVLDRKSVV